ncbi:MAG: hypothetical protein LBD78_09700, partial [Spirochaetaceae bacterium]|nr:hypothetical protein [Spirochaetaceae bacterium]
TIDELLQQLVEEAEAPFEGVTLTYELFKTFGGTIYLGPNQTGEVSGSTKITADTILYIPITEEEEIVDIEMYSELFSRSLRLPSLRPN